MIEQFEDGTFFVGTPDGIRPGVYSAPGLSDPRTGAQITGYWARLKNLTGEDHILANFAGLGPKIVELDGTERAFTSQRCGRWVRIGQPELEAVASAIDDRRHRQTQTSYAEAGSPPPVWGTLEELALLLRLVKEALPEGLDLEEADGQTVPFAVSEQEALRSDEHAFYEEPLVEMQLIAGPPGDPSVVLSALATGMLEIADHHVVFGEGEKWPGRSFRCDAGRSLMRLPSPESSSADLEAWTREIGERIAEVLNLHRERAIECKSCGSLTYDATDRAGRTGFCRGCWPSHYR